MATFHIAPQFNGPPGMGNGGYSAGLVARLCNESRTGGDAPITVRLRSPIPLASELSLVETEQGWQALHGEQVLATATAGKLTLQAPPAPSFEEAREAAGRYAGLGGGVNASYTGCFVCGVERSVGDGLRVFAGSLPGSDLVAAPFLPDPTFANGAGNLPSELIWAALDCPGYFAAFPDNQFALLGELTVRIDGEVRTNEPHMVLGWPLDRQGRKRRAGTAIYTSSGALCAVGVATWIVVRGEG